MLCFKYSHSLIDIYFNLTHIPLLFYHYSHSHYYPINTFFFIKEDFLILFFNNVLIVGLREDIN